VAVARANFFPTLSLGGSLSRDRVSANRPLAVAGSHTTYGDFDLSGQASWSPDFWGRIRRTVEQARATAQASAADRATLDLSLHAELAQDYFELRGLDSQSRLLENTVTDDEHQLDLNQRLLKGGLTTEVVVAQALTQLETTRAQLVDVNEARAEYEHAIATLINQEAANLTLPPARRSIWRCRGFRSACPRNSPSAGQTLPPRSAAWPLPMRKSASPSAPSIPPSGSVAAAGLKAPRPLPGFRGRVRSGHWARRPANCCLTPGSVMP
jgi:hypothetical protein